jgi:Tol biopolymer transport system component
MRTIERTATLTAATILGLVAGSALPAPQGGGGTMVAVQDLSWSADGKRLFFSAMRVKRDYSDYTPDKWAVYRYDLGTKGLRGVAVSAFSVAAAPASRRIAVGRLDGKNRDIWLLDEDGGSPTRLTTDPAEDFGPTWSPDERRIAFTSKRDGHAEIYVVGADGSGERRLTRHATDRSYNPSWSPDGSHLAYYLEKGDGQDQVFVMRADGTDPVNVTGDGFNNVFPGWTPEGRIVYGQGVKGEKTMRVFAVDRDGRNKQPLLQIDSFYARYSPDGSSIAYVARSEPDGARLEVVDRTGGAIATVSLGAVGPDRP